MKIKFYDENKQLLMFLPINCKVRIDFLYVKKEDLNMVPKVTQYFLSANSSQGFVSLFEDNLAVLDRVFLLKGGPGTGKSTLMKKVGNHFLKLGFDIDFVYCSSDIQSLDAVIIPKLGAAIVDATAPHVLEPKVPGAVETYVNLGLALNRERLLPQKEQILALKDTLAASYQNLYTHYRDALDIHDDWEKIFIDQMDFDLAEIFKEKVCDELVDFPPLDRPSRSSHRFFGASTPAGAFDFIENITQNLEKRYFIKGRPGTGKSTLMKAIAEKGLSLGYDAHIYHCSFDPKSLDMVLFPQAGICFFDSTAPHEYFPSKDTDQILDTYAAFVHPGTDEAHAVAIGAFAEAYGAKMKAGQKELSKAKEAHQQLENIYVRATNFEIIEAFMKQIIDEIQELI